MGKTLSLAIGSDHGGFELKSYLKDELIKENYNIIDCGTYSLDSCHYPTYAFKVGEMVASNQVTFGIIICTSGEGVTICANKVKGVRCGLCYNKDVARLMVEHNDANMIAFGAKYISKEDALECIKIFLEAQFQQGRHLIRKQLILDYENENYK